MKSGNELRYLAEKYGWTVGPLTHAGILKMTSDQCQFHEIFNKAEYERAVSEPQTKAAAKKEAAKAAEETERVKAENQNISEQWAGKKFWSSSITPEKLQDVAEQVKVFHSNYPQLTDSEENGDALRAWLSAAQLPFTAKNLSKAFEALAREGRLILNPSACGIIRIQMGDGRVLDILAEELPDYQRKNPPTIEGRGLYRRTVQKPIKILPPVEAVTGPELSRHPLLKTLLTSCDPTEEQRRRVESSADQYLKDFLMPIAKKELGEEHSQIERDSTLQVANTLFSLHPECINSPENIDRLSVYLQERNLDPTLKNLETAYETLKTKLDLNPNVAVSTSGQRAITTGGTVRSGAVGVTSSLTAKINSMSSAEYSEWLKIPSNKKAADALAASR